MQVSVIIPTYNYAQYIEEAIHSVLQQDIARRDLEIIVVDDGSTDETKTVLEKYINEKIIRYYYQENKGKAAATKKGFELATGEVIFNLDADDYFLPGKILSTVALFENDPFLVHVASPAKIVYADQRPSIIEPIPKRLLGRLIEGTDLLKYFFNNKLLYGGGSTFAGKASVLKQLTWSDEIDMYTDEWLLIETLLKGDSYFLHQPLSVWRVHGKNYSGQKAQDNKQQIQQRMEKSSATILRLLEAGDYPRWLKRRYRLKHEVRKMVWLEERGQKSIADVISFFSKTVLSGTPVKVLHHYRAFNRLAPGWFKNAISR